jgi:hypothetical protein
MKPSLRGLRVQSPSLTLKPEVPRSREGLIRSLRGLGMPVKRARGCAGDIERLQESLDTIERAAVAETIRGWL